MHVVDHAPAAWFLLADGDRLFLDAACNNSAFGYSWLIELNADERLAYERGGHAYGDWLAQDIHMGVPILKVSRSRYKDRDCSRALGDAVRAAIKRWREAGGGEFLMEEA